MFKINYSKTNFKIRFLDNVTLNKNKESALRGILGQTLIDYNCIVPKEEISCKDCYYCNSCTVSNIMTTKLKRPVKFIGEYTAPSYVIECSNKATVFKDDDFLEFSIIMFGEAIIHIPQIIYSFNIAGLTRGLGNNKFNLVEVKNERNEFIFDGGKIIKENIQRSNINDYITNRKQSLKDISGFIIETPIRYKKNGALQDKIGNEDLVNLLIRRRVVLEALESSEEVEVGITKDYLDLSIKDSYWEERSRYSNKQNISMILGGVKGKIKLNIKDTEILDYLILGELAHIGKSTSLGLGKYKLI